VRPKPDVLPEGIQRVFEMTFGVVVKHGIVSPSGRDLRMPWYIPVSLESRTWPDASISAKTI
jgi:hypothetical protein